MTTRGIRRKKSTLTELKIAVVGAPSVGKSGRYSLYTPHNTFFPPPLSPLATLYEINFLLFFVFVIIIA